MLRSLVSHRVRASVGGQLLRRSCCLLPRVRPMQSPPAVGKSTLLTLMTGTESEAAAYEFTTLTAIPGTINYKDTKIQMLDLPGIIEGAAEGKGRGRQVIACAKSADLILMVLDAGKPWTHKEILTRELESMGIRLNQRPPQIYFKKRKGGGIHFNRREAEPAACGRRRGVPPWALADVPRTPLPYPPLALCSSVPLTRMDEKLCYQILHEYKIHNAEVLFREDCGADELIDVIEGNRKYVKCLYAYNKIDVISLEEVDQLARQPMSVPMSCYQRLNLDGLLDRIWEELALVRVYTKKTGSKPDFTEPVVLTHVRPWGFAAPSFCRSLPSTSGIACRRAEAACRWRPCARPCTPNCCGTSSTRSCGAPAPSTIRSALDWCTSSRTRTSCRSSRPRWRGRGRPRGASNPHQTNRSSWTTGRRRRS